MTKTTLSPNTIREKKGRGDILKRSVEKKQNAVVNILKGSKYAESSLTNI